MSMRLPRMEVKDEGIKGRGSREEVSKEEVVWRVYG